MKKVNFGSPSRQVGGLQPPNLRQSEPQETSARSLAYTVLQSQNPRQPLNGLFKAVGGSFVIFCTRVQFSEIKCFLLRGLVGFGFFVNEFTVRFGWIWV